MVTLKGPKKSTALLTFDSFFEQFSHKTYKKGQAIIRSGEIPPDIYYLSRGYVRAYALSAEGEELTVIIFQPGDFFPLISTIEVKKINYFVDAMTEVEIISVPRAKFIEFLKNREDLLIDLTMRLTARFEGVLLRMQYLVFGTALQRLASIIVILAERFGEVRGKEIYIKAPLIHRDLASLVGITRETTTLILSEFTKGGVIEIIKKQIIVKKMKNLRDFSLIGENENITG